MVTPDVAYQFCAADGVVAVNMPVIEAEERIRWKLQRGRKLLTVDDRHAFILTIDDTIAVVKLVSGELVQTIQANGLILPMPQPLGAAIYLASPDGRVFCARSKDTPFLRADAVREALAPPAEAPATTQPAAAAPEPAPTNTLEQLLREGPVGPPVGGKSKVSRDFGGGTPPKQP